MSPPATLLSPPATPPAVPPAPPGAATNAATARPRLAVAAAPGMSPTRLHAAGMAAGWEVVMAGRGPEIDLVIDMTGTARPPRSGRICRFEDEAGRPVLTEVALRRVWERPPYCVTIRLVGDGVAPQWARVGTRGPREAVRAQLLQTASRLLGRALAGTPTASPLPAIPAAPPQGGFWPVGRWLGERWAGWLSWQASRWQSRLCAEWWSIGIADRPLAEILRTGALGPVRWLRPHRGKAYWADPFPWPGRDRLLCEEYPLHGGPGRLAVLQPTAAGGWERERLLLADAWHHSYPYTFRDADGVVLLPESAAQGTCTLYRLGDDGGLVPLACVAARPLADATLFRHDGKYWVAASDLAIGAHDNLCLFWATALAGPWHPHAANPVKIDIRSARPGGTPFVVDGRLYRPAQDCARGYGAALVISEIITLTAQDFEERMVRRLAPDASGPLPDGLHTLSGAGDRTLVDGKRMMLTPDLALRKMLRRLRRGGPA